MTREQGVRKARVEAQGRFAKGVIITHITGSGRSHARLANDAQIPTSRPSDKQAAAYTRLAADDLRADDAGGREADDALIHGVSVEKRA